MENYKDILANIITHIYFVRSKWVAMLQLLRNKIIRDWFKQFGEQKNEGKQEWLFRMRLILSV